MLWWSSMGFSSGKQCSLSRNPISQGMISGVRSVGVHSEMTHPCFPFPAIHPHSHLWIKPNFLNRFWNVLLFLQDWSCDQLWPDGLFVTFEEFCAGKAVLGFLFCSFNFQMFWFGFCFFPSLNICIIWVMRLALLATHQTSLYDLTLFCNFSITELP